jgi:hypothetical protein
MENKKITRELRDNREAMLRISRAGHHGGPTPDAPQAEYTARDRRDMRRHPENYDEATLREALGDEADDIIRKLEAED